MPTWKTIVAKVGEVAKAVAAAVVPLVTVSLTDGAFDWRSILAAGLSAVAVYLIPNYVPKVVAQVKATVNQSNAPPPAVVTPKVVLAPAQLPATQSQLDESKGVIG